MAAAAQRETEVENKQRGDRHPGLRKLGRAASLSKARPDGPYRKKYRRPACKAPALARPIPLAGRSAAEIPADRHGICRAYARHADGRANRKFSVEPGAVYL